ncbi:MAG: polysaccharide deacetylase family protein, partial [Chitinophagaceae bacterium]
MGNYFIKTPWWLKKIYPGYLWSMPAKDPAIYLTFDDGPHPVATPFVLDQLKAFGARATFFCIGRNVVAYPEIYRRIIEEGHTVGNHTQTHPNGWKTKDNIYLQDIGEAARHIDSALFRPPYGRITSFQARQLPVAIQREKAAVVMWDVLSADFDEALSPQQCLEHVVLHSVKGSVIVFHDSAKAFPRLEYCLPRALHFFRDKGWRMESLKSDTGGRG